MVPRCSYPNVWKLWICFLWDFADVTEGLEMGGLSWIIWMGSARGRQEYQRLTRYKDGIRSQRR